MSASGAGGDSSFLAGTVVLHDPVVLAPSGDFSRVPGLVAQDGRIVSVGALPTGLSRDARHLDAGGLWVAPGIVDCHTHLAWDAFLSEDRADATPGDVPDIEDGSHGGHGAHGPTLDILARTLRGGVTRARDAGGLTTGVRDAVDAGRRAGPRLQVSVEMIRGDDVGGPAGMITRVRDVVVRGADWVKLVATHGVDAPDGADLEPLLDPATMRAAVGTARAAGVPVMVHAWGGQALTDAINAGATSIEHGMFLSEADAALAASVGTTLVPTLTIYQDVALMAARGELPAPIGARATAAAAAHQGAVRIALAAGVRVALGSDFSTPDSHGRSIREIASLARAGLGIERAWLAATREGHRLMSVGRENTARGVLAPGEPLDVVVLDRDPTDLAVLDEAAPPAGVLADGRAVALPERWADR